MEPSESGMNAVMSPKELSSAFEKVYGAPPEIMTVAPGRINLIGEHTDYNDGFVFPAAIDRRLYAAARRVDGPTRLFSEELREGQEFDAPTVELKQVDEWAAYVAGMAWVFREETGTKVQNIEAFVHSEVPIGSGVSSSAALELAFGVLWNELAKMGKSNKELALLGQKCENQYVGVNSGIMDQMASAMGRDGHAMFLDTRSLEIDYSPVPSEWSVVLCDTKKPRALTDSAYNERRSQCEEAARVLGRGSLRDASMELLDAKRSAMPEVVYRRAKHVISENERCLSFRGALSRQNKQAAGELMQASHVSLRDDYEVSCNELDRMAEAAWKAPGCVGARMTGAGFGGACVALVERSAADAFIPAVLQAYRESTGIDADLMICNVVQGAHVLQS
jgi:galactokinase